MILFAVLASLIATTLFELPVSPAYHAHRLLAGTRRQYRVACLAWWLRFAAPVGRVRDTRLAWARARYVVETATR
jgi:hypothetical protein